MEEGKAYGTFTKLSSKRAVVDMEYRHVDGKVHNGFSTVDVSRSDDLYDACYSRADALAETQKCRLESFKVGEAKFTMYFTNFGYSDGEVYETLEAAIVASAKKGFETTINSGGRPVGSWSPITGYRDLTI